jgi:hypothetical protein
MGETAKGCRIGENTKVWDKAVHDNQNFDHDKYNFTEMVMKVKCPNQG